jgi:1-deoxy-D-xylulose-5-phosphate reductoisomerase
LSSDRYKKSWRNWGGASLIGENRRAIRDLDSQAILLAGEQGVIERVCDRYLVHNQSTPTLEDIIAADQWARQQVVAASKILNSHTVRV